MLLSLTCIVGLIIDSVVIVTVGEWFALSRSEMLLIDTMESRRRATRIQVEDNRANGNSDRSPCAGRYICTPQRHEPRPRSPCAVTV